MWHLAAPPSPGGLSNPLQGSQPRGLVCWMDNSMREDGAEKPLAIQGLSTGGQAEIEESGLRRSRHRSGFALPTLRYRDCTYGGQRAAAAGAPAESSLPTWRLHMRLHGVFMC